MRRGIEYKVVSYAMPGGQPQEFSRLSEEDRSECTQKMLVSMGKALSDHYSAHQEEVPALMNQPFAETVIY